MRWWPGACEAGDLIRVKLGSIHHYGVFVSEAEVIQFGLPPADLAKIRPEEIRVLSTDIDVFSCGQIVEKAELTPAEERRRIPRQETVRRARARIGEAGYDLLHNNCEHFARDCVFGEARCEQEETVRSWWRRRLGIKE